MRFTTQTKKKFSPSAKGDRDSGHYWVLWSGRLGGPDVWRIGAYYENTGSWKMVDDDRFYYDKDFMEIDERRIRRELSIAVQLIRTSLLIIAVAAFLSFLALQFIQQKSITK